LIPHASTSEDGHLQFGLAETTIIHALPYATGMLEWQSNDCH